MSKLLKDYTGQEHHVVLSEGIEEIGEQAFQDSSIRSIVLPKTLKVIRYMAFGNCKYLEKVVLQQGIMEIGECAFIGCLRLNRINLPDTILEIGDSAFMGCRDLCECTLPVSAHIGYNAFSGCNPLNLILQGGCDRTKIDDPILRLKAGICPFCPDGILKHEKENTWVCEQCGKKLNREEMEEMAKLNVRNGVVLEERIHMYHCLRIPEGITRIDTCAFYDGFAEDISVPDTVSTIGQGAFQDCDRMIYLHLSQKLRRLEDSICTDTCLQSIAVPKSTYYIGRHAFEKSLALKSVDLPSGLQMIGDDAFSETDLAAVCIPASIIGRSAFECCEALQWLYLESSVRRVGDYSFSNCFSLKTVVMDEGVTVIGDGAFWGCISLSRIELPTSLVYIGKDAFLECNELKEAILPVSLRWAGFESCFPAHTTVRYVEKVINQKDVYDDMFDKLNNADLKSQKETYEKLCKQADLAPSGKLQYFIGECYANGFGVSKNCKEAIAWFKKAARSCYPEAMVRLHELSSISDGKHKTRQYVFQAATLGNRKAIRHIAGGEF